MTPLHPNRFGVMVTWRSWRLARHSGGFASSVTIGPFTVYWF
jgi:hypothetical protein